MKLSLKHDLCIILQSTKRRYFINFCSWNKIPEPKTPDDAIPVMGTPVLHDMDDNGMNLIQGCRID